MVRLFDSVILHFDWAMDTSKNSMLVSQTNSEVGFLESMFDLSKFHKFLQQTSSFEKLLESFEQSTNRFWHSCNQEIGETYIYADERAYSEILIAFLKALYPSSGVEKSFLIYNLIFDKFEYCESHVYRANYRKNFSIFKEMFQTSLSEPLDPDLVPQLNFENLLGNYLACEKDEASLELLKPSTLKIAEEFIWFDVASARRWAMTGIYDANRLNGVPSPSLEQPSLSNYLDQHPEMAVFGLAKEMDEMKFPKSTLNPAQFSKHPFREKIFRDLFIPSSKAKTLMEACYKKDPRNIIEADMAVEWGSFMLSDSRRAVEYQYLLVSYLYNCARHERNDLLAPFRLSI